MLIIICRITADCGFLNADLKNIMDGLKSEITNPKSEINIEWQNSFN